MNNQHAFKIGQTVIYIGDGGWYDVGTSEPASGQGNNEILKIAHIIQVGKYAGSLCFEKYGLTDDNSYISTEFKPIQYQSAIKDLVSVKVISETSDVPMKNPSPIQPLKELANN